MSPEVDQNQEGTHPAGTSATLGLPGGLVRGSYLFSPAHAHSGGLGSQIHVLEYFLSAGGSIGGAPRLLPRPAPFGRVITTRKRQR